MYSVPRRRRIETRGGDEVAKRDQTMCKDVIGLGQDEELKEAALDLQVGEGSRRTDWLRDRRDRWLSF